MWLYYVYRALTWLSPKVPAAFGYWVAERVGDLIFFWNPEVRDHIEHNQRHVLGAGATDKQVANKARLALRNLMKNYFDQFRLWALSAQELMDRVELQGLKYLEEALEHGKGVVLVTAHFGSPEIVAQSLAVRDYQITSVVEHIQPEEFFQLMYSLRTSHGLELLPIDGPLLKLVRTLRKNGIVGLVGDRDITESGICVPFFGEEAQMPDGAVQLALRTGASLLVAYSVRLPDNRFRAIGRPPIYLEQTGDFDADVRAGVEKIVCEMERFIGESPEQWVVSVPLWDTGCNDKGG